MTLNLDAITNHDLITASHVDDLDDALLPLMDKAGITTGDIAGLVLDHDRWKETAPPFRVDMLREWLKTETLYHGVPQQTVAAALNATKMADAMEASANLRDYDLGNGWVADWTKAKPGVGTSIYAVNEVMTIRNPATNEAICLTAESIERLRSIFSAKSMPERVRDVVAHLDEPAFTFWQFQATKRVSRDLGADLNDALWADRKTPATGLLYSNGFYIEDVDAEWTDDIRQQGMYCLTIERDQWISGDLAMLERKLYDFAISSGLTIDDVRPYYDDMPLLLNAGDLINVTLGAFLRDNSCDVEEEQAIIEGLQATGRYAGGGGAAATWDLEKVFS